MEEKRTSVFENGLIWFGAAVSIAEILTGTYFAPLGFTKGLFAILIGHIIGCAMLFLAGLIGGKVRKSAMLANGELGLIIFLRDPLTAQPHEPDVSALLRLCDVQKIPLATNASSAIIMLESLKNGTFATKE